ncbi:hypothetical protein BC833DRAFT_640199 [Globomyces pollinis-pini]|nr:hypothetical protein BC833DRAFT_640199 [Globomyces pollinis-pini]
MDHWKLDASELSVLVIFECGPFEPCLHSLFKFPNDFEEEIVVAQIHQGKLHSANHDKLVRFPGGEMATNSQISFSTSKDLLVRGWKILLFIGPYPNVTKLEYGMNLNIPNKFPRFSLFQFDKVCILDYVWKNDGIPLELDIDHSGDQHKISIEFPPLSDEFKKEFLISIRLCRSEISEVSNRTTEYKESDFSIRNDKTYLSIRKEETNILSRKKTVVEDSTLALPVNCSSWKKGKASKSSLTFPLKNNSFEKTKSDLTPSTKKYSDMKNYNHPLHGPICAHLDTHIDGLGLGL